MKQTIAASVVAVALVVAPAAPAAAGQNEAKEPTSLRFSSSLAKVFADAAAHQRVENGEHAMVLAENPGTNVMVARRNADGSITIGCFDNAPAARRFVAAQQATPSSAPEVK